MMETSVMKELTSPGKESKTKTFLFLFLTHFS